MSGWVGGCEQQSAYGDADSWRTVTAHGHSTRSQRTQIPPMYNPPAVKLGVALVQRVDQRDETAGLVPPRHVHHRHPVEKDGVVLPRDREIVLRAERPVAELAEVEARDAVGGTLRDLDLAA